MLGLLFFIQIMNTCAEELTDKIKFCVNLDCDSDITSHVCGIRKEAEGYRLKIFQNECDLLKYGCKVDSKKAYGLINVEYCDESFPIENLGNKTELNHLNNITEAKFALNNCDGICEKSINTPTCGIREQGKGFMISLFDSECEMLQHNCAKQVNYTKAFLSLCDDIDADQPDNSAYVTKENKTLNPDKVNDERIRATVPKNIVVINTPFSANLNETIDAFFEATHLTKIPITQVPLEDQVTNETNRRMLLKSAGPVMVFRPWITIPKEVKDDKLHKPTLASCYHKCPEKCPDTYAPVCGVPGIIAREPSLMFKNHCLMDKAQCKMYWEDKSPTARSSAYVESAFLFCLGDEITGLYRFLPLVRTLQRMGRLKKRGKFRYKLRNLRFFNNLLSREPNLMG